jgi:hypothetical protein
MRRWRLVTFVASATGCATPPLPADQGMEFTALVPDPFDHLDEPDGGPVAPLRAAVIWLEGTRIRVTSDTPVRGAEVEARLEWPSHVRTKELNPIENVLLAQDDYTYTVGGHYLEPSPVISEGYRPRVVVYQDGNRDGELSLEETSSDRVVATDVTVGVAALLDPEDAFRRMKLEQARQYYSDGRGYSRFLFVTASGSELRVTAPVTIFLVGGTHAARREDILCGRTVTPQRLAVQTRALVDDTLDPAVSCPRGVAECTGVSFEELPPLEYESAGDVQRYASCRRSSDLASLTVSESTVECDSCLCKETPGISIYLASRQATPSWWPCGDTVDYCDDGADVASGAYCSVFPEDLLGGARDAGSADGGSISTLE